MDIIYTESYIKGENAFRDWKRSFTMLNKKNTIENPYDEGTIDWSNFETAVEDAMWDHNYSLCFGDSE